jgi:hypothetical protein
MTSPVTLLLVGLGLVGVVFLFAWWHSAREGGHPHAFPTTPQLGLGAVAPCWVGYAVVRAWTTWPMVAGARWRFFNGLAGRSI